MVWPDAAAIYNVSIMLFKTFLNTKDAVSKGLYAVKNKYNIRNFKNKECNSYLHQILAYLM